MIDKTTQQREPNPYSDQSDEWIQNNLTNRFRWIRSRPVLIAGILLFVIVLGGLFVAHSLALPGVSQSDVAQMQIRSIEQAVKAYYMKTGQLPDHLKDLVACPADLSNAKWKGPYLDGGNLPPDPWGNHFVLQESKLGDQVIVAIISTGADHLFGNEDDIRTRFEIPVRRVPGKRLNFKFRSSN